MLNPSPSTSPSLTPQDYNNNRKRLRSLSLESESSSSSPKRSMSQDPSLDAHGTPRRHDLPTPPAEDQDMIDEIDSYLAEQGEASGAPAAEHPLEATSSAPSTSTLTPKEKHEKIVAMGKRDMVVGETWYVVSRRWWKRWEKACLGTVDKEGAVDEKDIGPVDNKHLVDLKGNLATQQVVEGVDVEFIPEEAWTLLQEWYVRTRATDVRLTP